MESNIGKTGVAECTIDKIDVKAEPRELVDLYYRLELLYFVKVLLCQNSENR
jgi:hypothetical protein